MQSKAILSLLINLRKLDFVRGITRTILQRGRFVIKTRSNLKFTQLFLIVGTVHPQTKQCLPKPLNDDLPASGGVELTFVEQFIAGKVRVFTASGSVAQRSFLIGRNG